MIDSGTHCLLTERGEVDGMTYTLVRKLLVVAIPESLGRANLSAPGFESLACAVISEVALFHETRLYIKFRDAEGTGIDAVAASDTARWVRLLHDAFWGDENGNRRANLSAGGEWVLTVHTDSGLRCYTHIACNEVHHDHTLAFM